MVASLTPCNARQLEKLLSDELSELEEARATDHIERCPTCRTHLETLAAGDDWWQEAGRHLQGSRWNPDGTLWLRSSDFAERRTSSDNASVMTSLEFLDSSDNPAMLGRLGTYEIMEVIGSGGFGIVLKGYDGELNRYVAVKVLSPHLAHNAAARKRFTREAQAAAAVVHPHVVAIHAIDANGKIPYLVMPLIAGESLQERLDREGPLDVKEILRIGLQVAQGLAAAHAQGVVHRDVKPANILLERGVDRVMLTDFGLARAMDDAALTRTAVIAGTPQYMSPEQAQGESIDQRTDLFSLGSVLYAMCTGHPPFRAQTLMGILRRISDSTPRDVREVNAEIPEWLAAIVAKLHARGPADRFASAAELAELLEQCLAHVQQPTAVPLPPIAGLRKTRRRKLAWWVLPGLVALSVTLAVAYGPWSHRVSPPDPPQDGALSDSPARPAVPQVTSSPAESSRLKTEDALDWKDGLDVELFHIERSLSEFEVQVRSE